MVVMVQKLGAGALSLMESSGQVALLFLETIRCLWCYPWRWLLIVQQIYFIGVRSITVVMITGGFTGAVFAAQTFFQFSQLSMSSAVGPVVSVSMCRELGPVLAALMIAGRVGSAMAAEIATMKITEQLDALRSLAVYPVEYLVAPRFVAMVVSMPVLVAMAIVSGIALGYYVAVPLLGVDGVYYWENTKTFTGGKDIIIGLTKSFFFGLIIILIGCNKGLQSDFSAEGVGHATTEAVVNASIAVLIANFFLTFFLNAVLVYW